MMPSVLRVSSGKPEGRFSKTRAWALLFSGLALFLRPAAAAPSVQGDVMTNVQVAASQSACTSTPPPSTSSFTYNGPNPNLWFALSGVTTGSSFLIQYSDPTGAVNAAYSQSFTNVSANTEWFCESSVPSTEARGTWTVRVYWNTTNSAPLFALPFMLQGPPVSITTSGLPQGMVGSPYSFSLGAAGGASPYSWSWSAAGATNIGTLPPGLSLNSNTGAITGTPTAAGTYAVSVRVTDSAQGTASSQFSLVINPAMTGPPLTITTFALQSGTAGVSYSQALQATGGSPPYVWSVSGQPTTLSLNGNTLTGTPTAAGNYNVTVQVTDSNKGSASAQFTLVVGAAIPALTVTTKSLPNGTVGASYSLALQATGGSPPYAWSVSGQPATLSLNGNTLTGTPTAAGNYNVTVQVTDSNQGSASAQFTLVVSAATPTLTITTKSLPNGTVGLNYSQTIQASGGTPQYTFSVAVGLLGGSTSLPAGLTLNPNGTLSGAPTTAGSYTVSITVTDSANAAVTATIPLTIVPAPTITTTSPLPAGTIGTAYSQTIQVSGGTPPYVFSIGSGGAAPPGLALNPNAGVLSGTPTTVGNYTFTVQVLDSMQATASMAFQLTIAATTPALNVAPLSLSFTGNIGGNSPAPQVITVLASTTPPPQFSLQIDSGTPNSAAPAWLTASPSSGATPGSITVLVASGTLTANIYNATIHIVTLPAGTQPNIDVPVSFTLSAGTPQMSVSPSYLRFAARIDAPAMLEQVLMVQNLGGGGPVNFSASVVGKSPWIASVTPGVGQTAPAAPVLLRVDVNTQGLAVGSYRDAILITFSGGSIAVPVNLFVSDHGAILGVSGNGVRFQARANNGASTPQIIKVFNLGDPAATLNWTATLLTGTDWLTIGGSASGTATPAAPGTLALVPNSADGGLPAGVRYALISVAAPNALDSPQYVVGVLDNAPETSAALPDPSPAGLVFTASSMGAANSQTVQVYTNSATPQAFQVGVATVDGASWLTAAASPATASTATPGQIMVGIQASGLSAGVYSGSVNIGMNGALRTVNVTLIVPTTVPAATNAHAVAGCTPSSLVMAQTGLVNHFSVPAGWPATLILQLTDNCGTPILNGSMVASFSNGDPPLSLLSDNATGTYSATWQPRMAAAQTAITVLATSGALPSETAQFNGAVNANTATPPVLFPNGTVNNSNIVAGGALAPGTVAQVFGSGLASSSVPLPAPPLPNQFNGTFMLIGGTQAPLYYLSAGQLDVQIPFELTPNRQYSVIVNANGALTLPDTINVVPVSPGVTSFADGTLIAQHLDFSLVDATHPAKPGEYLTIYLAGMGATNPAVASGQPSPSVAPFAVPVQAPTVTVDGQHANVVFDGLTPGYAGLYQISFQVPAGANAGNLDVIVTQGTVSSNTAKLLVAP